MSNFLAIHPHMTVVVHGTEIKQCAIVLHRHSLETLLKPDGTLIEEQAFVLGVPVARNLHRWRLVEVVFYQILRALWFRILEKSPLCGLHTIVVITLLLHVHDVVPLAVEQQTLIGIHILNQWQFLSRPCLWKHRPHHQHDYT